MGITQQIIPAELPDDCLVADAHGQRYIPVVTLPERYTHGDVKDGEALAAQIHDGMKQGTIRTTRDAHQASFAYPRLRLDMLAYRDPAKVCPTCGRVG